MSSPDVLTQGGGLVALRHLAQEMLDDGDSYLEDYGERLAESSPIDDGLGDSVN